MKVPGFSDIGSGAKDLLYGGKTGLFQYDKVLTVNAKTAQGVNVVLKATEKDGVLTMPVKMSYKQGMFSVDVIPSDPKVSLTVTKQVIDGLKVNFAGSFPKIESTAKATVDYTHPYLTTKGSCTLNPTPVVDLSAVVGYSGFLIGGNAVLNVTQSKLTKWTAAASYNTDEMVATAHVADALDSLKLTYWQKIDAASTIGAEVVHTRATSAVAIALGYAHVNPSGDLTKVKFASDGNIQGLYEFKLRPDTTLATSVSLYTHDMKAAPRIGLGIDHSP